MAMAQRLVVLLILASIAVAVLADDIAGAASVEAQKYKHHDKEDDYKPAKHPGYKRHADDDEPDYDKYGHKYEPSRPKYKSHEGKAPSYDKDGDYYTYPADPKPTPNPLDACEPGTLTEVKRITQSWNTGTKNQVASCTDASLPGYNATATLQVGGECSLDPCTNPDGYDKVHLNKVKWMAGDAAGPFNATVNTQCAAGAPSGGHGCTLNTIALCCAPKKSL